MSNDAGRKRADVLQDMAAIQEKFRGECPLKAFPGSRVTWYRQPETGEIIPGYQAGVVNQQNALFILPDFVQHNGMTMGVGSQEWPADTKHNFQNNYEHNLPGANKNWAELCCGGTPKKRMREGVLGDAGSLEGKTAIICAPGPSLERDANDVMQIRAHNDNVRVFAFNRAMRRVKADYCVAVERWCPEPWREPVVFERQKDATLITAVQAHPYLAEHWPNDKVYWGKVCLGIFDDEKYRGLKLMDALASTSAAVAIRVAYEMGAAKIVLVGMDFSAPIKLMIVRAPLPASIHDGRHEALYDMCKFVLSSRGHDGECVNLAKKVGRFENELEQHAWKFVWAAQNFYFDQNIADTEYANDMRFRLWQPFRAPDGSIIGTTKEMVAYAEQLKCVLGMIESGSDCRIISANPGGYLDWAGVAGTNPHPPMKLADAVAWEDDPYRMYGIDIKPEETMPTNTEPVLAGVC